ncbi:MAG: acetoacetate decarboxylase family protein [Chromatiaceae bacterium]|nr:acetoacetate decarboxylase family protein [Chromatiaceae bacterium]
MKNGSYFIPREQLQGFMNPAAMNNQEGLTIYWQTDPAIARRVLPPPLELVTPDQPLVYAYAVNIREPTFAPWYMEAGLGLLCRYGETTGIYFLNIQLSGPGAPMGLCSGREFSGLPKKLCERILVERTDTWAHALVESKGRRIFEIEAELGAYNDPLMAQFYKDVGPGCRQQGSCLLFKYEAGGGPEGQTTFPRMCLVNYDSANDYQSWEPGSIAALRMEPSLDDPWAELTVVKPLGVGYSILSNPVFGVSTLAEFEGEEADKLFSYLFSGRWDRSTICSGHQRYGQFL